MKVLLIFSLFLMTDGAFSAVVTGYVGGMVYIKCKYDAELKSNTKYFCKGLQMGCEDKIRTGDSGMKVKDDRFSLYDDRNHSVFWVLIRNLTKDDSGTYQCAVDIKRFPDSYSSVSLEVNDDYERIHKDVRVGGDVNITCRFPDSLRNHIKFMCKEKASAGCTYKDSVTEGQNSVNTDSFDLNEIEPQQSVIVTFNLRNPQAGTYWCGAEIDLESDAGYKVYITMIILTVNDGSSSSPPSLLTTTPTRASTATSTATHRLSGPSASTSFQHEAAPPTTVFSSADVTIISMSAIIFLILIGTLVLILMLRRKNKTQGSAGGAAAGSGNKQQVSPGASLYEEIPDVGRSPSPPSASSTVYAFVQPFSNQSDLSPAVQTSMGLPTIPCYSTNSLYVSAGPPLNPSCSSGSSAVPPQQSNHRSAETVSYAAVSFHAATRGSNGAGPKFSVNPNEASCDYATVS